ncbi:RING finger protein 208 [Erpetoichthys calabaricus]|uniref:Im:7152348 n=1 Tax=Erpetoichthys calabaricus TaxID=27687 RepID=A0A8C4S8S6_ERPCA|nr:RING finger protein 208 [Erpetoichthys calabaricus]
MALVEDMECGVCYLPYSRSGREPRLLHCGHTFCTPCLCCVSQERKGALTLTCPLCRRVTCIGQELALQEALWVDTEVWNQIPEMEVEEEDEEGKEITAEALTEDPSECNSVAVRPKLKIPSFLKKLWFRRSRRNSREATVR